MRFPHRREQLLALAYQVQSALEALKGLPSGAEDPVVYDELCKLAEPMMEPILKGSLRRITRHLMELVLNVRIGQLFECEKETILDGIDVDRKRLVDVEIRHESLMARTDAREPIVFVLTFGYVGVNDDGTLSELTIHDEECTEGNFSYKQVEA